MGRVDYGLIPCIRIVVRMKLKVFIGLSLDDDDERAKKGG